MSDGDRTRGTGLYVTLLLLGVGAATGGLYYRRELQTRELAHNERNATACLKIITAAEADFRANDRDENDLHDYWTGDLAGLYSVKSRKGQPILLIERRLAEADAVPILPASAVPIPMHGYYFMALDSDDSNPDPADKLYRQDTGGKTSAGKVHHRAAFGFCAYPVEWGVTGRYAFIVNEYNNVYRSTVSGPPPKTWPADLHLKEFWTRAD